MLTVNGVRNGTLNAPVINGQLSAEINGIRSVVLNGQRNHGVVWNGNRFMTPSPNSVLYLPGYPGFGSTIYDFSTNYSDSGIDTNEVLDATETGIDCDADATTAIPAGTIIQIESEKCMVTATGVTLTVTRGYQGTIATTHVTNIDIWKWTPNNGAITGATWKRLRSGLWYLYYTTDDRVTVTDAANLSFGDSLTDVAFTILAWVNMEDATICPIFAKIDGATREYTAEGGSDDKLYFRIYDADNTVYHQLLSDATITTYQASWVLFAWTYDGSGLNTGLAQYVGVNGVVSTIASTPSTVGAYTAMHDTAADLWIGASKYAVPVYSKANIAIPQIIRTEAWTQAEIQEFYKRTYRTQDI